MPPIPITRAEYERKFGVKPIASSTSTLDDEEPAPIRITRSEWNALQTQWKPDNSYMADMGRDFKETGQAQQQAIQTGVDRSGDISNRVASGETSKLKGAFQKFGTGLGTASNVLFQTALGGAKALLPQSVEDRIAERYGPILEKVSSPETRSNFIEKLKKSEGGLLVDKDVDQSTAVFLEEVGQAYRNDPNFRTDVQSAGGIAEWLTLPSGFKKVGTEVIDASIDAGKGTLKKADEIVTPIKKKFDERGVNNVVKEIDQIENKYVKTRNANTYSKDIEASQRRIAESNVLDGSTDKDGVIRTKVDGGAIDQYRAQTIDGYEDIVKRKLEDTKETMQFADVGKALIREIGNSGLEGADLVTALKKIGKELEGLSIRTKGSSIIDLTYLQDAKIATTRNINYLTPPEKVTYRKAVARAYKVLIEKNSTKFDVKAVNEGPLARAYEDIARLERLDGARAEGGRLGKYTASLAGTGIGMAAGSVAGGFGAAIGGALGGELAQAMKGAGMSRTFKAGGKGLTPDPLLVQTKLSIPDKAVKAKAEVPKTKEITELESQIAKNVADQKKAIKKGDFALVQALKEIYVVLVEELKSIIKRYKELSPKDKQGGFVNFGAKLGDEAKPTLTAPEAIAKGMSKEEWIKGQGETVYHGTNAKFENFDISKKGSTQGFNEPGLFFTSSKDSAKTYNADFVQKPKYKMTPSEIKYNSSLSVKNVVIDTTKIKNLSTELTSAYKNREITTKPEFGFVRPSSFFDNNRDAIHQLIKARPDIQGLKFTSEGETIYMITDTKVIKTRAQLSAQFDEATKATPKTGALSAPEAIAKGMSKEEWIKGHVLVYHGTPTPLKQFNNKQGTFFTDDMMNADGYASGENVYEGYLNFKNPLVIDAKGAFHRELKTSLGKTTREVVANVDKSKYDGVIFKNIKDSWIDDADADTPSTIYYSFKPKDAFLNESQLSAQYDEAVKANRKASEAEK